MDEVYSGEYGDETKKAIWFLDKNDKVCLRVRRAYRDNLNEVLKIVDKFEDKFEDKIKNLKLNNLQKLNLHFALAKAYEDIGDIENSVHKFFV